ncbi:HEAT repeat domain-containing protein [Catellatospora sichuanensis]|uniref:HEAT repeat domain-containing protein n=1 Tax=Catellatospora sichuanensis TaxID=1969805 RepID=UPI001FECAAFA|nr:HEAT repeat domain-containing protein [Catellatospora sichuanensis]
MSKFFRDCMRLMRSRDPQEMEDGFHDLLPHAAGYVPELIAAFEREQEDHGLRCWLLELLGGARSEAALPVFREHLYGDDTSLRFWAVSGLRNLGTRQARRELWQARCNGIID